MAETSKKKTARIPLDYYKRPDRLSTWKLILSAAALLAAAGWAFGLNWDFWIVSRRAERSRQLASHGPLARPHATWDSQCEACHVPFRPIGQASWAAPLIGNSARSDAKCMGCHPVAIHHASQVPHDLACAGCHHDHRGREASLVRMPDQHCTQCHADLTAHVKGDQALAIAERVTRFDADPAHHPEVGQKGSVDPGNLKFDHKRHLSAGMPLDTGGPVQQLGSLRAADRARYRPFAKGPGDTIQLDCSACHQLQRPRDDPASAPEAGMAGGGAYMLPIQYEKDCRACHPLDFDPAEPDRVMSHPLQPAEVSKSLREIYTTKYISQDPTLLERRIPPRPLPGQPETPALRKAREVIERKVRNAETILFGPKKCGECHHYETADHRPLDSWDRDQVVRIKPTNIPEVWLRSAAFDHSAHQAIGCRQCHARAYPDHKDASRRSQDFLLPASQQCLECHGPSRRGRDGGPGRGGAGFDCTECHRYHNGDAPTQALGATALDAGAGPAIRQFLLAQPSSGRP